MSDKAYYQMTVKEALEDLGSSDEGLTDVEASRRLKTHGPNELTADLGVSRVLLLLSQFKDLLVIVLIVAAGISFAIGSSRDATVMLIIVAINAIIGFVQEYKVSRILESLRKLIRSPAKVLRGGTMAEIAQENLVPGDIVRLEAGDRVPADLRIIESFDLRTEDFSLTGESMPQGKTTSAIPEEVVLGDRDNMAYMGTTVTSGSATGLVAATGMTTEMGRIAAMTKATTETASPLERELGALARWLTAVVVVVGGILFAVALWQGLGLFTSMVYALGIAVALVPQALPAQVTVAMATTSRRLAERHAVVKNLPSVETLGSTSVISTDKTGTLTKNEMTATAVWFNNSYYSLTGTGYEPRGSLFDGEDQRVDQDGIAEIEILMDAGTMASNAEIHEPDADHPGWYPVGDPTEAALVTMSTKLGTRSPTEDEDNPEIQEFPFDSERKRMSSVRQFGDRFELAMKGAPDSVLRISKFLYRDGKPAPMTDHDRKTIEQVTDEFSKRALRVLAIAYRPLESNGKDYTMEEVEKDVVFLGLVGMMDPPKEGVREAVESCHTAGIRTFIMTGDHAITAQAIGREIGLADSGGDSVVITGQELKKITDEELTGIMKTHRSLIFSRVDPEDKLRIVTLLEDSGEVVAVTGDGVNDAPALRKSDIGVAMGRVGTDVAKEASEVILLDDSFPTLVHAVREGRTIYRNLRKTVLASLTTNGAELFVVLLGLGAVAMRNWAIPILAIQILAIDLLAEVMPLTFLTYDPPPEDAMRRPPRDMGEHIVNWRTASEVTLLGLLIGILSFANYALFMQRHGVVFTVDFADPLQYAKATTVAYLTIAFCQFSNILSRRDTYRSVFSGGFFSNKILLASIAGSIAMMLLAINVPFIRDFLRFSPPSLVDWLYVIGAGVVYLTAFEVMKLVKRMRRAAAV